MSVILGWITSTTLHRLAGLHAVSPALEQSERHGGWGRLLWLPLFVWGGRVLPRMPLFYSPSAFSLGLWDYGTLSSYRALPLSAPPLSLPFFPGRVPLQFQPASGLNSSCLYSCAPPCPPSTLNLVAFVLLGHCDPVNASHSLCLSYEGTVYSLPAVCPKPILFLV